MHPKIKLLGIYMLVFFAVANIIVVYCYEISTLPISEKTTFHPDLRTDYREQIEKEKPEVIILGDSAISYLDEEIVSEVIGKKTKVFAFPGTGSAYWYLFIRNQVFLARHRPEFLLVIFRDSMLTVPAYRVQGEYFTRLEEVASDWDQDVYALAINNIKPKLMRIADSYIPLLSYRNEIFREYIHWARNFVPALFSIAGEMEINNAYETVFEREQINDQLWELQFMNQETILYTAQSMDFSANVRESFLPAMIRDLMMMDIKPIFMRAKYRSHTTDTAVAPELEAYLDNLSAYFGDAGVLFADLSQEPRLTESMFADNFHIHSSAGRAASQITAENIRALME